MAAALSIPLRRLAGVSDRSYINGYTLVLGSLVLWTLGGLLHAVLCPHRRDAARWTISGVAIAAALAIAVILTNLGPLAPYPRHFAACAIPLVLLVTLGGAAVFAGVLRARFSPALPALGAAVAAIAVGVVVVQADSSPGVHYTLGRLAPAASAGLEAGSGATAGAGAPASTSLDANAATPLHLAVSPVDSEVSYTIREKLTKLFAPSDAVGKTSSITGDVYLTPAGLASSPPSSFTADLRTLSSDSTVRDRFIHRSSLQSDTYPNAIYTITGIDGFPVNYQQGQQAKVTVNGTMKIHNTQRPLTWTGVAQYADGRLETVLSADFNMTDFNITPPNTPIAQAQNGVHLDLHLVLSQQQG